MSTPAVTDAPIAQAPEPPGPPAPAPAGFGAPAPPGRRAAAYAIDLGLLALGMMLAAGVGLQLATDAVAAGVGIGWVVVVGPLYFALYHAFGGPEGGPGATPGEHEVGVFVCDPSNGERLPVRAAVGRAYLGLVSFVLVLPGLLVMAQASGARRTWRDRLAGAEVRYLPGSGRTPIELAPTDPSEAEIFVPQGKPGAKLLSRSFRLVKRHPSVAASVLATYVALTVLAALLVPLILTDVTSSNEENAFELWTTYAILLFVSGVYWTQATLVTAIESVRVGEPWPGIRETLRRASARVNALTVAMLLVMLVLPFAYFILPIVLLGRLCLMVPAIILEDRSVLGGINRSWMLTRGHTWRALGMLVGSALVLYVTWPFVLTIAFIVTAVGAGDTPSVTQFALVASAGLLVASVPVCLLLSVIGSAWCLYFHDLRAAAASGGEA